MNPEELSHLVKKLEGDVRKNTRLARINIALTAFLTILLLSSVFWFHSRVPVRSQLDAGTSTQTPEGYADDTDDKLLQDMREVWKPTGSQSNFGPDPHLAPTVAILVRAVVLLDRSSSRLTKVGLGLTFAGLVLTGVSFVPIWPKIKNWFTGLSAYEGKRP